MLQRTKRSSKYTVHEGPLETDMQNPGLHGVHRSGQIQNSTEASGPTKLQCAWEIPRSSGYDRGYK